jgi:uncharacterized membrane protein YfcA
MSALLLLAIAGVALAAFTTEGAIGFGSTVLAASIGAQLVPLAVLLPAFVPLNLALSSYLLSRGVRSIDWRYLALTVAPPVAAGTAVGLLLLHLEAKAVLALVFGVFVVGLAVLQLARPGNGPLGRVLQTAMLVLGGVAHGLFGTGGPMIVYVVRRRLADKRAFRSTLAVLWFVLNIALLTSFAAGGMYSAEVGKLSGVLAITIVPGLALGEHVHGRLDPVRFERAVWAILLGAGAALAVRSAWSLA